MVKFMKPTQEEYRIEVRTKKGQLLRGIETSRLDEALEIFKTQKLVSPLEFVGLTSKSGKLKRVL